MHVVQLMASPFVGGPEKQMLGVAEALRAGVRTTFISFYEGGRARALLDEAAARDFGTHALEHNFPYVQASVSEVKHRLTEIGADVVCCSGYKPDLVGVLAGRALSLPVVAVTHGWTACTWKVRLYEGLDRVLLRWMDRIVCVSPDQADIVRRQGIPAERVRVIVNGIVPATRNAGDSVREELLQRFDGPPSVIVAAAGRLSREKNYHLLVDAAAICMRHDPHMKFVLFGDGLQRGDLEHHIALRGMQGSFVLAGFDPAWERFLPSVDIFAMSSVTEGLPVVLLEACAQGVPVVATAVGGIPYLIKHGENGFLARSDDAADLAHWVVTLSRSAKSRHRLGSRARHAVIERFSVDRQARDYAKVFGEAIEGKRRRASHPERLPRMVNAVTGHLRAYRHSRA